MTVSNTAFGQGYTLYGTQDFTTQPPVMDWDNVNSIYYQSQLNAPPEVSYNQDLFISSNSAGSNSGQILLTGSSAGNVTRGDMLSNSHAGVTAPPEQQQEEEGGFWHGIGRMALAPLSTTWEQIKSVGKYAWNTVKGAWNGTVGALGTLLSGHPIDAIGEAFEGAWEVFKAPFVLGWDLCKDTWNGIKESFGGAWEAITSIF